jgi:archaellum component FlaC
MSNDKIEEIKVRIKELMKKIETRTEKVIFIKELESILTDLNEKPELKEQIKGLYEEAEDLILLYTASEPKTCAYDSFIKEKL